MMVSVQQEMNSTMFTLCSAKRVAMKATTPGVASSSSGRMHNDHRAIVMLH